MMRTVIVIISGIIGSVVLAVLPFVIYDAVLLIRRPLKRLYRQRSQEPDYRSLDSIPDEFVRILLLLEDEFFYKHRGIRVRAIRGALRINLKRGMIIAGGSTITQQLMKNLYFKSFEKRYLRKIAEVLLALWAEVDLGKTKILEMYMNIIYFGNGIYGVSEAARFYFDKDIKDLNLNQMYLLASIPKAPTRGNPIQYPEVFERLRNKNIDFFVECGLLSDEERDEIISHDASCLDEELRNPDEYTDNYPQYIVMTNEKYGPDPVIRIGENYEISA